MKFDNLMKTIFIVPVLGLILVGGMTTALAEKGAALPAMDSAGLGLAGVENAWDIGGYITMDGHHVKRGVLLRSGKLDKATEKDKKQLLEVYHLQEIIDLRTTAERSQAMDPVLPDVNAVWLKILNENVESSSNNMIANIFQKPATGIPESTNPAYGIVQAIKAGAYSPAMYTPIVNSDYSRKQYHAFFMELLKSRDGALLWHCTGGKDRTGVAAVLTLAALGVDKETIIKDYLLTNDFSARTIAYISAEAAKLTQDQAILRTVPKLVGVDREIIDSFYDAIEKQYGSMDEFLKNGIGLTKQDITQLRAMYLE